MTIDARQKLVNRIRVGTQTAGIQHTLADVAAGVSLRQVTKKYGPVTAVEDVTLDIPAGSYCCLLGPSGCAKQRCYE